MIKIIDTNIKDVKIIEPQIFKDKRGHFFESYNESEFFNHVDKIKWDLSDCKVMGSNNTTCKFSFEEHFN